jgi:hypothetical protein
MSRPYGTYNKTDDPPPPDMEHDCEGEGPEDCGCKTCRDSCKFCRGELAKKQIGDEYYEICKECRKFQ